MVYGADDVGDHRFGGIEDSPQLAHGGVVGGEEGLVEVNHGVLPPGPPPEILQDFMHKRGRQKLGKGVHHPCDALIQFGPGDVAEELPEKGIGFGNAARRPAWKRGAKKTASAWAKASR